MIYNTGRAFLAYGLGVSLQLVVEDGAPTLALPGTVLSPAGSRSFPQPPLGESVLWPGSSRMDAVRQGQMGQS